MQLRMQLRSGSALIVMRLATIGMQRSEAAPTCSGRSHASHRGLWRQPDLRPGLDARTQTYPALLQQRIAAEGHNYRVVNAGVTGDTSSEALRRFDARAACPRRRSCILAIGGNDGLRGVPVATVERNLAHDDRARAGARHSTCCCAAWRRRRSAGSATPSSSIASYTRLADRYSLPLVPFFLLRHRR